MNRKIKIFYGEIKQANCESLYFQDIVKRNNLQIVLDIKIENEMATIYGIGTEEDMIKLLTII